MPEPHTIIDLALAHMERSLGRELSPAELAYVMAAMIGWRALMHGGMCPSQVAALARAEVDANTTH